MSDRVLKDLLKEEKRRRSERPERNERRDKSKTRSDKSKTRRDKDRQRDRERDRERRDKYHDKTKEPKEPSIEIVEPVNDGKERFMFLYEDSEGKIHKDLNKLENEGKIFPVYFIGGNDNLNQEIITFRGDEWTSSEEENSWLNVINSNDENIIILPFDVEDVVVYNGRFFHCKDDLIEYIEREGCEYLDVV